MSPVLRALEFPATHTHTNTKMDKMDKMDKLVSCPIKGHAPLSKPCPLGSTQRLWASAEQTPGSLARYSQEH